MLSLNLYGVLHYSYEIRLSNKCYVPPRLDRLWGPPSLLSNGYRGLFPAGKAAGTWNWPLASI